MGIPFQPVENNMSVPPSIRVVDVRGFRTPEQRAAVCYVGRAFAGWPAHPLGNPFRVRPRDRNQNRGSVVRTVGEALDRYIGWLRMRPNLDREIAALWEACKHGAKPLGCWCVNAVHGDGQAVVCHAQILAAELHRRYCR